MARIVQLDWSQACYWGEFPDACHECGVYQITRSWGAYEHLRYVGIVWGDGRSFRKRMQEHRKAWLGEMRGINYRFATLRPLRGLSRTRDLVEEIEGALIQELRPPDNSSKTGYYSLRSELVIQSFGDRGFAPRTLDTRRHIAV